jgi:hypothetical protein
MRKIIMSANEDGMLVAKDANVYGPHFCGAPAYVHGHDAYMSGSGMRGDAVCIPVEFESGHIGNLWIAAHKGEMLLRLDVDDPPTTSELDAMIDRNAGRTRPSVGVPFVVSTKNGGFDDAGDVGLPE